MATQNYKYKKGENIPVSFIRKRDYSLNGERIIKNINLTVSNIRRTTEKTSF